MKKRDFIKQLSIPATTLGACQLSWRDMMIAKGAELRQKQKSMILLWMDGGPTHFETFDPKPDAPAEFRGEFGYAKTSVPGAMPPNVP